MRAKWKDPPCAPDLMNETPGGATDPCWGMVEEHFSEQVVVIWTQEAGDQSAGESLIANAIVQLREGGTTLLPLKLDPDRVNILRDPGATDAREHAGIVLTGYGSL